MATQTVRVSNRDISLSKLDKGLYPEDGITKADVIEHYQIVADAMVPHLVARPLTMLRFPDGIGAKGFFQKGAPDYFPDWLKVVEVPLRQGGSVRHVICEDAATLVYLANQATIEYHIWTSTLDDLEHPDRLVIDLDPPAGTDAAVVRDVALRVGALFDELGLAPFTQATGGSGFHVIAPLDRSADFEFVHEFAIRIAEYLAGRDPDRLTTRQRRDERGGRIFLDVNRNAYGQTFVAPYSLRARPGAPVATPLDRAELETGTPNGHTLRGMPRRLARKADPWTNMDRRAVAAAKACSRLEAKRS